MIMKLNEEQIKKKDEGDKGYKWHFILNIVHLSIFDITHIKLINVWEQINSLIEDDKLWINAYDTPMELYKEIDMSHIINLNIDVLTVISKKAKLLKEDEECETFFLFESGNKSRKLEKLKSYR